VLDFVGEGFGGDRSIKILELHVEKGTEMKNCQYFFEIYGSHMI